MPSYEYCFGNFQTETFSNSFGDSDTFVAKFRTNPMSSLAGDSLADSDLAVIFYLLYSKYGNSHYSTMDQYQAEYQVFSKVIAYGPRFIREYKVQKDLLTMSEEDLLSGSKTIYNHAYNPGTDPTVEELDQVDDQNTTKIKRSRLDAYEYLLSLLDDSVVDRFLKRFKDLFLTFVKPTGPIWFKEEE